MDRTRLRAVIRPAIALGSAEIRRFSPKAGTCRKRESARFEDEDAFTYVVTSEDGLDSATWSAGSLEIATYEGDGRYVLRGWNRAGRHSETPLRVRIADEPDVAGNGAWVLELEQRAADGSVMETRERFTWLTARCK